MLGDRRDGPSLTSRPQRRPRLVGLVLATLAIWMAGLTLSSAGAAAPAAKLTSYKHTVWTAEQGAPPGVKALAQTPDGFLWLATQTGLFRFDGMRFQAIAPAKAQADHGSQPVSLYVSAAGELWVGYSQAGGVAVFRNGKLVDTAMPTPPPMILSFFEAGQGDVWAIWGGYNDRLWRHRQGKWTKTDGDLGVPAAGAIGSPTVTKDGALWLFLMDRGAGETFFLRLPRGGRRFETIPVQSSIPSLAQTDAGALWVSDSGGTRPLIAGPGGRFVEGRTNYPATPNLRVPQVVFDRQGAAWGVTRTGGLFYIQKPHDGDRSPAVVNFTQLDGLSSDFTNDVLRDREGSIWVATDRGLDQFRPADILLNRSIPANLFGMSIAVDTQGTVYVLSTGGLYEIRPRETGRLKLVPREELQTICPARNGSIWLMYTSHAIRLSDRAEAGIPIPGPPGPISACTEDAQGRLWFTSVNRLRYHDQQGWHDLPTAPLGAALGTEIITDPSGQVLANLNGRLLTLNGAGQPVSAPTTTAGVGYINGLSPTPRYALVNGSAGLARVNGGRRATLDGRTYPWATRVRDSLQTRSGDTWLLGPTSLVRVPTAALDAAFERPGAAVATKLFDIDNGLAAGSQGFNARGSQIVEGADGRVWFLTSMGVMSIDPRNLEKSRLAPPVAITTLSAGAFTAADPKDVSVPGAADNVTIDFSALSLAIPSRNTVRYRLEGIDRDWVDAGIRRQAFYTRLPPGDHVFRVIAANPDGVWNSQGAELRFKTSPTFLQSWLFKVLVALTIATAFAIVLSLRSRQVARRVRARMEVQLAERERIARDLHDTLLQSVQGLIIRFHSISLFPRLDDRVREAINETLTEAEGALVEGREQVAGLRKGRVGGLRSEIEAVLEKARLPASLTVTVRAEGDERALEPATVDECSKIVAEAVNNARLHADAASIAITIVYRDRALEVTVSDDGRGIPHAILRNGGRVGHYGLRGMSERAERIGGMLDISSAIGGGCSVSVRVPARFAYRGGGQIPFAQWAPQRLAQWLRRDRRRV